jgi:peptidyl-dipeptidase Dcp
MIEFNTPLQSVPFDKIETRHYKPAFEAAIKEAGKGLESISESSGKTTFQNTIEAL